MIDATLDTFPVILDSLPPTPARLVDTLTQTQKQVAELAAQGMPMKAIAAKLATTPGSVRVMLSRYIYPVLGVSSQPELIRFWIERIEQRGNCETCLLRMAHLQ
jgi:DNA-binding NarL/FixJ family response regulator